MRTSVQKYITYAVFKRGDVSLLFFPQTSSVLEVAVWAFRPFVVGGIHVSNFTAACHVFLVTSLLSKRGIEDFLFQHLFSIYAPLLMRRHKLLMVGMFFYSFRCKLIEAFAFTCMNFLSCSTENIFLMANIVRMNEQNRSCSWYFMTTPSLCSCIFNSLSLPCVLRTRKAFMLFYTQNNWDYCVFSAHFISTSN